MTTAKIIFNILLFNGFETLDALGPAEVIGRLHGHYRLRCVSVGGGAVTSAQGITVQTEPMDCDASAAVAGCAGATGDSGFGGNCANSGDNSGLVNRSPMVAGGNESAEQVFLGKAAGVGDGPVLLIPGGQGTRPLVNDAEYIEWLRQRAVAASRVLTVCTGSALLAKTGVLDGLPATTNKIAFDWVASLRPQVLWQRQARWVRAGRIYTSSGISAGIDMTLGFVADHNGLPAAQEAARQMEYIWNRDSTDDPFAGQGVGA